MAKFNEKALCLFYKNYDQLEKEAKRRGIDTRVHSDPCDPANVYSSPKSRERIISEILYKDAYDAGVNAGKEAAATAAPYCPANYYGNTKPEVSEYCFYDINDATKYRLELTEEQVSAIEWMIDHRFMVDVELSEWCDSFEDVGRI